jgi:hypothetical protein
MSDAIPLPDIPFDPAAIEDDVSTTPHSRLLCTGEKVKISSSVIIGSELNSNPGSTPNDCDGQFVPLPLPPAPLEMDVVTDPEPEKEFDMPGISRSESPSASPSSSAGAGESSKSK